MNDLTKVNNDIDAALLAAKKALQTHAQFAAGLTARGGRAVTKAR
jgi:hypothetical protein